MKPRKRFLISIATFLVLGAVVHWRRPPTLDSALLKEWSYTRKAHASRDVTLLIFGDSRVSEAVDTRPFAERFPSHTPRNMGFPTAGFNQQTYDFLRELCAGRESEVILLLGVTPYGLSTETKGNGHFLEYWDQPRDVVQKRLHINPLLGFMEPIAPSAYFRDISREGRFVTYHSDGWEQAYELPFNPHRWLRMYYEAFNRSQVDPRNLQATRAFVREMSGKGVRVFGFRPPTTPEMEEIENTRSGFNEEEFIRDFEAAGGTWIALEDRFAYFSYDGSHLHYKAARSFSKDLAAALEAALQAKASAQAIPESSADSMRGG